MAGVCVAGLAWAGLRASHLLLPNLWLPASAEHLQAREQVQRVDPHVYDTQWFDAARAGRQDITQALIDAGFPVNSQNGSGYTALVLATYHGQLDEVMTLLQANADPCIADQNGNTALMGALFKGEMAVANQLLGRCAVDQANNSGQTALAFAALFGRLETIPALVKLGADLEHLDAQGKTALGVVLEQDNAQAAAALRDAGARAIGG
jgi:ankyrin repeat protein